MPVDNTNREQLSKKTFINGKNPTGSLKNLTTSYDFERESFLVPVLKFSSATPSDVVVTDEYTIVAASAVNTGVTLPQARLENKGKRYKITIAGKFPASVYVANGTFSSPAISTLTFPFVTINAGTTLNATVLDDGQYFLTYEDFYPNGGFDLDTNTLGSVESINTGFFDHFYVTKLILTNLPLGSIAGAGDEAFGIKLGDLPSNYVAVEATLGSFKLNNADGNITADTPEIGLGTTLAAGASATLGATENNLLGLTAADVNNTVADGSSFGGSSPFISTPVDTKDVYLNIADSWAGAESNLTISGNIVIKYITTGTIL